MTANPTIPATAAEDERSGYEDRLGQTRSGTPRLVPVPPPPNETRTAATVADRNRRAPSRLFSWHLIDPLRDRFELRMDAPDRPLARLTIGGIGTPRQGWTSAGSASCSSPTSWATLRSRSPTPTPGRSSPNSSGSGGAARGPCGSWKAASSGGAGPVGGSEPSPLSTGSVTCCCASIRTAAPSATVSTPRWSHQEARGTTSRCCSPWDGSCSSASVPQHRPTQSRYRDHVAVVIASLSGRRASPCHDCQRTANQAGLDSAMARDGRRL